MTRSSAGHGSAPRRTAVVIGAGQGIGKAIALALAKRSTHVHLVGRTGSKLESTAAEIYRSGGTATAYTADVSHPDALAPLAAELENGLDILVNCAGEALMNTFEETTFDDWQRMITANLTTSFLATRALLSALRRSSNASIIIVTSKAAVRGYPVVAYSAAKAGALGFARSLSAVLRQERIRVVALCPGPTDTPMRWDSTPDMNRDLVINPDSLAQTVQFLVDLPRGVTTHEIVIESMLND